MPSGVVKAEYCACPIFSLDGRERVLPCHLDLAHMADVEQASLRADRHMLVDDARVFDGHVPSAEWHHPGAKAPMAGIQRRFLELIG